MRRGIKLGLVTAAAVLVLSACSSIPSEIRNPAEGRVTVQEVREAPGDYTEHPVRWGGPIVAIENHENFTWVEILDKPLNYDGRPRDMDASSGRFIAKVPGYLEPGIYQQGREVTVFGNVERTAEGTVGQRPYLYPIVDVELIYLWDRQE